MASFYYHDLYWARMLLIGLLGGLGGGCLVHLLSHNSLEPPDSLKEALKSGGLHGGLAGLWGGLTAWLLLCVWNGMDTWLGLTPLP